MNVQTTNLKTVSRINTQISHSSWRRLSGLLISYVVVTSALFAKDAYEVTSTSTDARGVTLRLTKGAMRVEVCAPTTIHVVVTPSGTIPDQLVPVVIHRWSPVPFRYKESGGGALIDTGQMQVKIARNTGAITFAGHSGQTVLSEAVDGGKTLQPTNILGQEEWKVGQNFLAADDEALYGLGQRQEGLLDIKGIPIRLQQANTNISVPFLLSTKGYGLLWNNASLTDFDSATVKTGSCSTVSAGMPSEERRSRSSCGDRWAKAILQKPAWLLATG